MKKERKRKGTASTFSARVKEKKKGGYFRQEKAEKRKKSTAAPTRLEEGKKKKKRKRRIRARDKGRGSNLEERGRKGSSMMSPR